MTRSPTTQTGTAPRRRRYILAALTGVLVLAAVGLGYYWLKPAPPAQVSVERSQVIFKVTKDDLRGQTLQTALTKIAYPQSVFNDHVGDVWVVDVSNGPSQTLVPIPPDPGNWTVVAVGFRAGTPQTIAENQKLAPGQKPGLNFVTFGIRRTADLSGAQIATIVQGGLDDTLPGNSGTSGMTALRPGTGPTIRVQ
ncbi:hypothetical protein [Nocardia brasiliensis]|uniref:hypothetical protein n=1 Tax=Nocardia brasiliensis TaxID=37326 RepID=UPI0005A9DF20|nr:hypothetical protein [Nocardia brasiliensis]SUB54140.1 Uncharacterised protein [Nocardia brasiliensis]